MKTYLKPILLAATLLAAGNAMAAPPPVSADAPVDARKHGDGARGEHGPRGDKHHGGRHGEGREGRYGDRALRELRGLNLSDAQRESIRGVLEAQRGQRQQLGQKHREIADAFDALDPSARDYDKRVQGLSDQTAKLASEELRARAQLRAKIQAQLNPAQIQALQLKRAEHSARRAEFAKQRDGKPAAPRSKS